jgi:acetylornithine deacetylase/succinyl-diaminopimelate desuccinylase-like protein
MRRHLIAVISLAAAWAPAAASQSPDAGRAAFREILEEMVEIDSSPSTGSCTRVVQASEKRLRAAGFTDANLRVVIPPGKPDDGNIVAWLDGASDARKGVLLLAHIDVVDAKREDWERDPFTLVEENGFFYGRGVFDDKSMAAIFLDLMIRLKQEGFRPTRDLKMALTCGEETSNRVNGVEYMVNNHLELIDAEFALNEGGGPSLASRPMWFNLGVGQKIHQVVQLEVTNPGGHSSRPVPDNAIYRLSAALSRIEKFQFPVELNEVVRQSLATRGPIQGGKTGEAMTALAKNPKDKKALAVLEADPDVNNILRTTCVATQLDAGHAPNALPQRARAILSCRTMQTLSGDDLIKTLQKVVADDQVKVTIEKKRDASKALEMADEVMGPIRKMTEKMWPGLPIVPQMGAGANDGRFLLNVGIPTYGVHGIASVPGEVNAHGLNEKIRVKSLYEGREFLEGIVRMYVGPQPQG